MSPRQILKISNLLSILLMMLFCEPLTPQIERVRADKSSLAPGENTMLYCDVYNPAGVELVYAWHADAGRIEGMGASARYTAPSSVMANMVVTITATIGDGEGHTDSESIQLEVKASP